MKLNSTAGGVTRHGLNIKRGRSKDHLRNKLNYTVIPAWHSRFPTASSVEI
jgi:hypothetical protein